MRVYGIKIKSSIFEERFVGILGADPNGERETERRRRRRRRREKKKGVESDYLLLCLATHYRMELNLSGWVAKIATWGVLHLPILMLLGH